MIFSVLLVLNLLATGFLAVRVLRSDDSNIQYTLYIGLNDKDSYEQFIPTDEAKQLTDAICAKYASGFTIEDAIGAWSDEKGVVTHENTIVCYLNEIDEENVHRICEELRQTLNQNTILIRKEYAQREFYAGE